MADPTLKDIAARLDQLEALFRRIPGGGVVDPGPDPFGWWRPRGPFPVPGPFPHPGDPPTIDLSRFNKAQLTMTKEMLKSERSRLDAMEKLVDAQIKEAQG